MPIHPMIVHFPIVLIVVWPIVDVAGLFLARRDVSRVGVVLLVAALFASIAATVTGQSSFDAAVLLEVDPALLNSHADDANLVPWALLSILVLRSAGALKFGRAVHAASITLGFLMWIMMYVVGASGGALVYQHAVGVESAEAGIGR